MPMEKVSKLLNEYLESKEKDIKQFMNIAALMTQSDSKLYQIYIISKDFGFIKRLVDNYKIDMSKANYYSDYIYYDVDYWEWGWACKDYEFVIMLLSIQDKPIRFLCEILK